MKELLISERKGYVKQLDDVEKAITRTETSLASLRQQLEQLKGAIFAIDSVLQSLVSLEAKAKVEAEAKAKVEAVNEAVNEAETEANFKKTKHKTKEKGE